MRADPQARRQFRCAAERVRRPITAAAKGAERRKPDQPLRVLIADDDRDMVSTAPIAISGKWTASPDRLVARQCGFDHYLVKPCDPRQLVELIAGLRRA